MVCPFAYPLRGRMSPEELNRTIEFIVESQARLAAAQEHDRQDRVEFQEWSKGLSSRIARVEERQSQLLDRQSELLDLQSRRMDRVESVYEKWLKQNGQFQQEVLDFQRQALRLLNLILDRLPPGLPDSN